MIMTPVTVILVVRRLGLDDPVRLDVARLVVMMMVGVDGDRVRQTGHAMHVPCRRGRGQAERGDGEQQQVVQMVQARNTCVS